MTDRTPEEEAFVGMLLDYGALYIGGKDDDGNDLYFMDAKIMKEVCRPFYDMWMADIDAALLELYENSFGTSLSSSSQRFLISS